MNHLMRELAPITEAGWAEIDEEASQTLRHVLAGRKLIDFVGPLGWETASIATGRVEGLSEGPGEGVTASLRGTRALVELRTPFTLSRAELDAIDRGACDADLDPVRFAARTAAMAEDQAIFHGYPAGGIEGATELSPHEAVEIGSDYQRYPSFVAEAMSTLKSAGVTGPYAIALGPRCYTGVVEQSEMGGYPVLEHLRLILGGPVIWAPGIDGAVIVSLRGGDVEMICGQDFSVGYASHDAESVSLYLVETFTVRVCAPEAVIHLAYPS